MKFKKENYTLCLYVEKANGTCSEKEITIPLEWLLNNFLSPA